MARPRRIDAGGYVYHALNRGNGRMTLFKDDADYAAFENVLAEAQEKVPDVGLITWCIMPNHWHLVVRPRFDGGLSRFLRWVTLTHTQRWHAHRRSVGGGHVYQGRFKSFLVDTDRHLVAVCRYVERNPLRARLVKRAEEWRWSGLWRLINASPADPPVLAAWPSESGRRPGNWLQRVNEEQPEREVEVIRQAAQQGRPFGSPAWLQSIAPQLALPTATRPRGRPKKSRR